MAETVLIPADVKRAILFRQIGFLVVLAASVALGVQVVMWSQTPNYSLLYGSLSQQDISEVLDTLQKAGIEYRVEESSGAVMVPTSDVHDARLKLASAGLPKSTSSGFGMLDKEQGIGTSQFIEQARYQHALETELAKTIEKLGAVRSARVHLALPRQSTFIRSRKKAAASVLLDVYGGHELGEEQVSAISSLVAASVPNLEPARVSIVDQNGHLMSRDGSDGELAMSSSQFKYSRKVEESYARRIEDILAPIVGVNGVKAEVAAEFDFTRTEQTREFYNPDLPALRSEQVEENSRASGAADGGVPGALSNQPVTAENDNRDGNVTTPGESAQRIQRRSTRNYELDRTISHTKMQMGTLRRLSIAVLLDHKQVVNDSGEITYTEHSPEELLQITNLVKEAIGYNTLRGDRVNVVNAEFNRPGPVEALPEDPIWKQSWLHDLVKQVAGALFVLFLVFGVLRPSLKNLVNKEISLNQAVLASAPKAAAAAASAAGAVEGGALPGGEDVPQLNSPGNFRNSLEAVKDKTRDDPMLAAQVVKGWVGDES